MANQPMSIIADAAPLQLSISDVIRDSVKQRQRKCRHEFIPIRLGYDLELDEVYDGEICTKCGYSKYLFND